MESLNISLVCREFTALGGVTWHSINFACHDCQGGGSEFEPRNPLNPQKSHNQAVCGAFSFGKMALILC